MTEVRTRDEALDSVDSSLSQWSSTVAGVFAEAVAVSSAASTDADTVVRRLAAKVAALKQLLGSLSPEDGGAKVERDLAEAERSLEAAKVASRRVSTVAQRVSALQRSQVNGSEALVASARADLSRRMGVLGSYRAGLGPVAASSGAAPGGEAGGWLGGSGLSNVEVSAVDFTDNPIQDGYRKGGTTHADYRWAVQTWDEVIGPGVARGMTRADFEARDTARTAPSFRSTASVYDMFLGDSDRIRVTRRTDGSLDVTNGRHRLQMARELGIKSLPGEVIEP